MNGANRLSSSTSILTHRRRPSEVIREITPVSAVETNYSSKLTNYQESEKVRKKIVFQILEKISYFHWVNARRFREIVVVEPIVKLFSSRERRRREGYNGHTYLEIRWTVRDENSGGNDLLAAREILRVDHVVPTRVLDLEFLERRRSPNERAVARRRTARRFSLSSDIACFVESLCQNSQDALLQPLFHIAPETCHNISKRNC